MDLTSGNPVSTTRRAVVAAAGATGLAVALAACSGSNSDSAASSSSQQGGDTQAGGSSAGSSAAAPGGGSGGALAKTADIPQGGGKVFPDKQVVVTQPAAGTFKAFTAICTHQNCTVNEVKNGTINCPCHGSKFHIADGSVASGPATQPLAPAKISVENGSVKLT